MPGGPFRTFWEPVYKTSMPVAGEGAARAHERPSTTQGRLIPAGVSLQPGPSKPNTSFGEPGTPACNWSGVKGDSLGEPSLYPVGSDALSR